MSRVSHISLGIDIGMTTVKLVLWDRDRLEPREKVYRFHYGNPIQVIKEEATKLHLLPSMALAATGSNVELFARQSLVPVVDPIRAEILAVRQLFPDVRNIINVGGSSVAMITLTEKGTFQNYSANSLCAAGTGSFLDEQAGRLGISYSQLKGFVREQDIPVIATRCAVFAKSDIIHRQQQGYSKSAMWSGLCRGMTDTMLQTLLKGRPLKGLTVITGGVAQNAEIMYWLKARFGDMVQSFEDAHFSGAIGAALLAPEGSEAAKHPVHWGDLSDRETKTRQEELQKPLLLLKTKYPEFGVKENYTDLMGTEVRISHWPGGDHGGELEVYLGIDIGSTSTKMVVMDEGERILVDLYRKTAADPIGATKLLFAALEELAAATGTGLRAQGCGTTGSGRKLVGSVVGADCIVNEISAHVTGALHTDHHVETIFEIGGQDSKYMRIKGGHIRDSNMNYACAAGTGSFVEEQAKKLGFPLEEVGDIVLGIAPPRTSDRCTVFMEQDVHRLISRGYSREECMAAVMYSVCQNYLNKVVGKRPISGHKIFFQGATARNKGLVAAFENLLDGELVVSPYCHVMGAYGVALITRRTIRRARRNSRFKGLDLAGRKIEIRSESCTFCRDHCKISFARIEGEEEQPSWGYLCGRDPEARGKKENTNFAPFQVREKLLYSCGAGTRVPAGAPVVAIPRCLTTYTYYPLWQKFFSQLGFRLKLSSATAPPLVREGVRLAAADFCFPIKLALGHVRSLVDKDGVDFVFLPFMISTEQNPRTTNSYFCPYVQGFPGVAKTALAMNEFQAAKVLTPVVDFRWPPKRIARELSQKMGKALKHSAARMEAAWQSALECQAQFHHRCQETGRELLKEIAQGGEAGIVCIGRPYNTLDLGANLSLPRKIAELGYRVIPIDFIPVDWEEVGPYSNMYWSYGQRILNAISHVKRSPNLFAIYFTNFNCGPDSFILNFAEHEMGDKPFLTLEVDEHGADTGYITRLEAFLDVVKAWQPKFESRTIPRPREEADEFRRRKIWIPAMHPLASRLFAAAFRGFGYQSDSLPVETSDDLALGRSLARGSECLPMAATIGAFINQLRRIKAHPREHAFFMPTADGPCRFGQYALLHRMILNRVGYDDVPILSPSSQNSYQGLEEELRRHLFKSLVVADTLTKCACRVRPYEMSKGQTNGVLEENIKRLEKAFEAREELVPFVAAAAQDFSSIPTFASAKPLVGIVGEIYVRCNTFCNEELIATIEEYGGEAWLTPMVEWILYTTAMESWEAKERGDGLIDRGKSALKNYLMVRAEHGLIRPALKLLRDRLEPPIDEVLKEGAKHIPMNFGGEAILTLGRAVIFARQGARVVVNCSPFSCMPGALTAAILQKIQKDIGIPVLSTFYDGDGGLNYRLKFFLHNIG